MTAVASVVIPAHNEGQVIGRCLTALKASGLLDRLQVVVAANGCTDDTAAKARFVDGVTVLDLPQASKIAALNAGDRAATAFPRLYLDADVELTPEAVRSMVDVLLVDEPRVAAPQARFVSEGASWPVRAFYRMHGQLPSARDGIAGHGVYAVSAAGRQRFEDFPDVLGDDLFVTRLFGPHERVRANGAALIRTPTTLRELIAVRTRIARGNIELARRAADLPQGDFARTTSSTLRAALTVVRRSPTSLPDFLVFAGVGALARRRAATTTVAWHRDQSTR